MEDTLTLEQQKLYNHVLTDTLEKYYEPSYTVDSDRYVGIEIEVEKATPDKVNQVISSNFITVTEDGSLRDGGLEYITCPHKSKYTTNLLQHLFKLLKSTHDFSQRTSIHIHVNARDMTPKQIRSLLLVYLTVERLLYRWIKHDRDKSIFCVPILETDLATYLLNKKQYNWMKYTGINLKPIQNLGTIEFRHMHGNGNVTETIIPWLNMILSLFKFAKQYEYSYIRQRIFQLNTTSNYYSFLYDVFGPYTDLLTHSAFHKDMEEGVSYIKTHSLTNTFAKKCATQHPESPYIRKKSILFPPTNVTKTSSLIEYLKTVTPHSQPNPETI